jgi:AAA domain-containing protein/bifunctional DNA primase/polymerase-like protein
VVIVENESTTGNLLSAALAWWDEGFSIIPILANGSKRPAVEWKQYMSTRATRDQVLSWFTGTTYGLAVVCGAISGGLEMLELEGRACESEYLDQMYAAMDANHTKEIWNHLQNCYSEWTPSGGLHVLYRSTDWTVPGNTKIAIAANKLCLSETRGEGGYVIVAPSGGKVHPTREPWTVIQGAPSTIGKLTLDERTALHCAIHAGMDERPDRDDRPVIITNNDNLVMISSYSRPIDLGDRPGDAWMRVTPWEDILGQLGWAEESRRGSEIFWTRPGKDPRDGCSASTGRREDEQDCLYVWSSSAGLPTEEPLSKLFVLAHYYYNGSIQNAVKALSEKGFGAPTQYDNAIFEGVEIYNPKSPSLPSASKVDANGNEKGRLRVLSSNRFSIKRVRWLWDQRAPIGEITLVPGREGVGKSLLLASLASAITRGKLPGEFYGQPRAVVYCASEDSWPYTIAARLEAAGAVRSMVYRLDVDPEKDPSDGSPLLPNDCKEMRDLALSVNAACLMLDPIVSLVNPNLNSYSAPELRRALEPLRRAAEEADMSVLGLVHFNKSTGVDVSTRVGGSRAWMEVARAAIVVARMPKPDEDENDIDSLTSDRPNQVVLSQEKNNLGKLDQPNLVYKIVEVEIEASDGTMASVGKVEWMGETLVSAEDALNNSRKREKGVKMQDIVDFVAKKYGEDDLAVTLSTIVTHFTEYPYEMQYDNVKKTLGRAVQSKLLSKHGRGMYKPFDISSMVTKGIPEDEA